MQEKLTSRFFLLQEPGKKHLATLKESTQAWLVEHKIKGFYTVTESGEGGGGEGVHAGLAGWTQEFGALAVNRYTSFYVCICRSKIIRFVPTVGFIKIFALKIVKAIIYHLPHKIDLMHKHMLNYFSDFIDFME